MRISHKVDYGVRAMVALGRSSMSDPHTLVKREALATDAGIPPAFLDDILRSLRASALVLSQRGSSGGWRLAKPAKAIAVADIIRALEGPLASVRGIRPHELAANGVEDEALVGLWIAVRESLRSVLDNVSVADLVNGKLPKDVVALHKAARRLDDEVAMAHDHGGHDHSHSHGLNRAGARHMKPLLWALGLSSLILVVEVVTALTTGSLALLSDAGHMLTDVAGLGMAIAAIHLASRGNAREDRSFGLYRLEILAALANSLLLFGVAAYVLIEAAQRVGDAPDIASGAVLGVAALGLVANLVSFRLLRAGAAESVNVEGAYLEVLADLAGSAAVIVSAAVIAVTHWWWLDPVAGAALGLWILPRTYRLARKALRVLLQAAPDRIDLSAVHDDLAALPDVVDVHDLHIWTLTSEMDVATAHLMIRRDGDAHAVLDQARALLDERYHLAHATLQIEPEDHTGCDSVSW